MAARVVPKVLHGSLTPHPFVIQGLAVFSKKKAMINVRTGIGWTSMTIVLLLEPVGCSGPDVRHTRSPSIRPTNLACIEGEIWPRPIRGEVQLTSLHENEPTPSDLPTPTNEFEVLSPEGETLFDFEALAVANNPSLRRLRQIAAAEWAQVRYVDKLPDPTIGTTVFSPPMHLDPDRQLVNVDVMQTIPWIGRLHAEARRASFEALAAVNDYHVERLKVIGDLRAAWYQLYVLNKQVKTTEAEKAQLEALTNSATARVRTGDAQPGDVLLATLELSSLEEQLINYRREVAATTAEINRLAGRPGQWPVNAPVSIDIDLPPWDDELLLAAALARQPELNAARMRVSATRWGIEVARLQRRPDLTVGAGWMIMDAPGALAPGAGQDSATVGVTASIPLWREKYDGMSAEASRMHYAAHASEEEIALQLESLLRGLWAQAQASHQTVQLYKQTIIPQARQAFEADQTSLATDAVSFDRVIRDYRSLLSMQLRYHRAMGQLATTLARIQQAVGEDLWIPPSPEPIE